MTQLVTTTIIFNWTDITFKAFSPTKLILLYTFLLSVISVIVLYSLTEEHLCILCEVTTYKMILNVF